MSGLREFFYRVGSLGAAPRLLQRWLAPDGAAVLMYHAVTREALAVADWCFIAEPAFRAQMQYLQHHCRVVALRDLPAALARPETRPLVAVTFDDGYQNNYAVAFPILRELSLPATIFLTTDYVDSDDTLWFCRLNAALAQTARPRLAWDGATYDTASAPARAATSAALQRRLKEYPHAEFLAKLGELARVLGVSLDSPVPAESPFRMLKGAEIREMAASGLVDFGAHTCSHAILSGLSASERSREISASLQAVSRLTRSACGLFAYPNGRAQDYGAEDVAVLGGCGVGVAVTTIAGPVSTSGPRLEMPRYGVGADTSFAHFKLLVHHVLWKLRR